jgi:hypothetical protein
MRLSNYFRPDFSGTFGRTIGAAVIYDDYLAGNVCRSDRPHNIGNGLFFVQCRDNDAYPPRSGAGAHHAKTIQALVK